MEVEGLGGHLEYRNWGRGLGDRIEEEALAMNQVFSEEESPPGVWGQRQQRGKEPIEKWLKDNPQVDLKTVGEAWEGLGEGGGS